MYFPSVINSSTAAGVICFWTIITILLFSVWWLSSCYGQKKKKLSYQCKCAAETNGAFHLNLEVRIFRFPVGFRTWKVRSTSPTPTSKSNMAAPCINICESCSNILFISTSVLFVCHYTQVSMNRGADTGPVHGQTSPELQTWRLVVAMDACDSHTNDTRL